MKKYFFILLVMFASCAKDECVDCENICMHCTFLNDTLCSTDFQNKQMFENAKKIIEQSGDECLIISPSQLFEECDEDKKRLFKEGQYECF